MADSFKHIEEHFKKSMQDYTIPNSAGVTGFASVMAAANKKLFFKFMPKRFNIYYLSAAVAISTASTTIILLNNDKEPELIQTNEIVIDSAAVKENIENTAIFNDSIPEKEVTTESTQKEIITSDTLNLTPPENPVVSASEEIIPESIETPEEVIEEPAKEMELTEPEIEQANITTKSEPVQIDSTIVIEKEDVLIKNSEIKEKKQKVKKKGR